MGHELTITNGKAEMFYVESEGTPWHKLGTGVEEALTADQALEMSGQDWEVVTRPMYFKQVVDWEMTYQPVPNAQVVIRRDTKAVFGVVGSRYTPLQNRDAFRFADGLVAAGGAVFTTAGTLFGGKKTWMQLTLPGDLNVGKDKLRKKILLTNSHDGTSAFQVKAVLERVVCWNTLSFALSEAGSSFKARHTSGILSKVNDAREVLGLAEVYFEMLMRGIEGIVEQKMEEYEALEYFGQVYELDPDKLMKDQPAGKRMAVVASMALFKDGRGNVGETKWDALNAVTEYLDHVRPVGGLATAGVKGEAEVSKRLEHSWYGEGVGVRQRAWELLQV